MNLQLEIERRAFVARFATLQAGKLALDYFDRNLAIEYKADATPVTVADRHCEELLRGVFKKEFPKDGYLGEEFGEEPTATGFRWILDPIDGTKNYVRRIPFFATLVGLEYHGEVVAGCVAVPTMNLLYHAVRGMGAFRNDKRIQASAVATLKESQVIYTSLEWFAEHGRRPPFLKLVDQVQRTRGFGDFWGFLLVADGSVELALEPHMAPWDVAALKPIVEEAGAVFSDWNGINTIYGAGAVAGNQHIHPLAMKVLGAVSALPPASH